ncbi:MAG: heme exporter protein CcmD [Gammaproteobacteria bacterium]|nr:heme exporter protein CcmD [Gammaproteobacteria bacterium]
MLDGIVFSSVSEFLQMGTYALHVWTVYGVFAIFIFVNLYLPVAQRRQFIREQKRRAQRDAQVGKAKADQIAGQVDDSVVPGESE